MILCREEYAKKINSAVFPGQQGGPLEHVIAGKAVALKIAAVRARSASASSAPWPAPRRVAEELLGAGSGVNVLTGGTDVHLVLVDLRESELDGQQAEDRLHDIGITVNRNAVPFDPRPPMVTSGLRVGTPALATRGLQADDFPRSARSSPARCSPASRPSRGELAERVTAIADALPAVRAARRGRGGRVSASAAAPQHQPLRQRARRAARARAAELGRRGAVGGLAAPGAATTRSASARRRAPRRAARARATSCGKRTARSATRARRSARERPARRSARARASRASPKTSAGGPSRAGVDAVALLGRHVGVGADRARAARARLARPSARR